MKIAKILLDDQFLVWWLVPDIAAVIRNIS
jgi:hypothetical protein